MIIFAWILDTVRSNQTYNIRTLQRVELPANLMVSCQPIQSRVSYSLFFPTLIISSETKQRSGYKQPPRNKCIFDLPPLSVCRSCSKEFYMGRWVATHLVSAMSLR